MLAERDQGNTLRARVIKALTLASLLAALGFALHFNGREMDFYAYAGIAVFAALVLTLLAHQDCDIPIGPMGCLLIIFFAWNGLAITWSSIPYVSAIDLGILLAGVGIYLIWRTWNVRHSELPTPFLLVALGLGLSALMIAQYLMDLRPHGTLLNPNSAAAFLNFLWPFTATIWLDRSSANRSRQLALVATFALLFAVLLDGSRGALVGALAALTAVAFVGGYVRRDHGATFALVAVFATAFVAADSTGGHAASAGAASVTDTSLAGTSRLAIWQSAWEMVQERPWLGFGPGTFWIVYSAYRSPQDGSSGNWVHNDYLEFWLETGVIGLGLAFAIAAAALGLFITAIRRERSRPAPAGNLALATACFAGLTGVGTHSVVTFNLQMLPFVLVLGILTAELERGSDARPWVKLRIPSFQRIVPVIGLIALTVLVVGHYGRSALAFHYTERGSHLMSRGEYADANNVLAKAQSTWLQLDSAWYLNANVLLEAMRATPFPDGKRAELISQADTMLDRAEHYNPHRATTHLIRGLLRADHPELTSGSAKAALRRAIDLDPRNIESWYSLAQLYERDGELARARDLLERGIAFTQEAGVDASSLRQRLRRIGGQGPAEPSNAASGAPGQPPQTMR